MDELILAVISPIMRSLDGPPQQLFKQPYVFEGGAQAFGSLLQQIASVGRRLALAEVGGDHAQSLVSQADGNIGDVAVVAGAIPGNVCPARIQGGLGLFGHCSHRIEAHVVIAITQRAAVRPGNRHPRIAR